MCACMGACVVCVRPSARIRASVLSPCKCTAGKESFECFSCMCVCACVCFLWEEGDGNISGDDSPVFCDSGAERVLFTHLSPLGLAYKTRNGGRIQKKRRGRLGFREH